MRTTWQPLSNETKPLTFLLALTFLFLFSCSEQKPQPKIKQYEKKSERTEEKSALQQLP